MSSLTTIHPLKVRLRETAERIIATGRITRVDEKLLFQIATSNHALPEEETALIKLVFDRLQMGMLKVLDEWVDDTT